MDLDELPIHEDDEDEQDDSEWAAPLARRLVVVGGGKGGVGKSVLAQSLAVYFAQLGKQVVLADADPNGSNVHAMLGLPAASREPDLAPEAAAQFESFLVDSSVQGLRVLPAALDGIDGPPALRAGRKARWLARLRSIPCDYVVVDAGPGHGSLVVDLLLAADVAITVSVPEPPAIETTYRLLRAAFLRRLRRALARDRFRLALHDRTLKEIGRLPAPLELVRALERKDGALAALAWSEARRLHVYHVVNQTRLRADAELAAQMAQLTERHYGTELAELGYVEQDDSVWLSLRHRRPLLVDSPTSKAARNIERIARRVVALTSSRPHVGEAPPPLPPELPDLYRVLGVGRSASDEEVRRAYKRRLELYAPGNLATSALIPEAALVAEQDRIREAYDTILDPIRRRAYDLSTFPDEEERAAFERALPRPALAAEQLMLQGELEREIGPDTEFDGALLRKVRESQGIDLSEISARTKISRQHLQAIEDEAFDEMPAMVYVRGFVTELAKYLRLDPSQVQKTYLRRARERAHD